MVVKSVQKTLRLTTLSKQVEEIVNPACGKLVDHPGGLEQHFKYGRDKLKLSDDLSYALLRIVSMAKS